VKLTKLVLLASTPLLALTACGSDGGARDATFAGADARHMTRAFMAATGLDTEIGVLLAQTYAATPETSTGCPRIAHAGSRTTITGGCTTASGTPFAGSITVDNPPSSTPGVHDPSKPTTIRFDGFSTTDSKDGLLAFDGNVTLTDTNLAAELDVSYDHILTHSALELSHAGTLLTAAESSFVEVDQLGSAAVSGSWHLSSQKDTATGKVTLTGKDTVVFDLATVDDNACFAYTINGAAAGKQCPPPTK
jgi:hypothetical protein